MRKFLPLLLFIFFSSGSVVFAEGPAELREVVVYGEKESTTIETTASTTIDVKDYEHRIVTLPEVLSEQSGVHLTQFGGLEDATSISIRGSSADEVLILLDGVPMNTADGRAVDLSPFLMEGLESIEIHRGASPIQSGFSASAGSVLLKSKKLKKGRHGGASIGYGSFNTVKGHANFSKTRDRFGFLFSTTVSGTDGDFTFLDDNGTPVNTNDDQRVERQNNESLTIHPFFKLVYDFDENTRLEMVNHLIMKDSGVPGLSANQSETANLARNEYLGNIKFKRSSFLHKNLSWESQTYCRFVKHQYSDLQGEIGLGGAQDNDDETILIGQRNAFEFFWGKHQVLTPFFKYQFERFSPKNYLASPSEGGISKRYSWNAGLGDEIELFDQRLILNPVVWLENVYNSINNDDPSYMTPAVFTNNRAHHDVSARLGIRGIITDFLFLEAHAGRTFRYPTFSELFGDKGGVVGNQFLRPQESISWDAGFILEHESEKNFINQARFTFVYYDRRVTDLIQFEQQAGFARAENVGEAHVQGTEIRAVLEFFDHFGLSAGYTFQMAKDQANNPGRFLAGRPKHEVSAKLEGWVDRGKIFISLNWVDENFLDPLNTRVVNDRIILNSGLSFKVFKSFWAAFEAKNLTNEQIVDVIGFPLPGRSFFGKVSYFL